MSNSMRPIQLDKEHCLPFWPCCFHSHWHIIPQLISSSTAFFSFTAVGIEPRAVFMKGECFINELHPPPLLNSLFWNRVLVHCSGWPWTCNLPASASGVAGITFQILLLSYTTPTILPHSKFLSQSFFLFLVLPLFFICTSTLSLPRSLFSQLVK